MRSSAEAKPYKVMAPSRTWVCTAKAASWPSRQAGGGSRGDEQPVADAADLDDEVDRSVAERAPFGHHAAK